VKIQLSAKRSYAELLKQKRRVILNFKLLILNGFTPAKGKKHRTITQLKQAVFLKIQIIPR
jgi:hypothetical protein